MKNTLYYFYDPMCSWCYAFQPALRKIRAGLPPQLEFVKVLGGLAADDDAVMPVALQTSIQGHWQRIQQTVPGTEFNFDFWKKCQPRRSTYPACRAVIAAGRQQADMADSMLEAIQQAYYREARNPSDTATHIELATALGLDAEQFLSDLQSAHTEAELQKQIRFTYSMGVAGFPSLLLVTAAARQPLPIDYLDSEGMLAQIKQLLDADPAAGKAH